MEQIPTQQFEDDSIDLIALLKSIWSERKRIIRWTAYFIAIGILVALLSPKEYTATATFIPQTSESGKAGGSLSGLASLAGINLGGVSSGGEIPPSLYPELLNAVPVKRSILAIEVPLEGAKSSYGDYLSNKPQSALGTLKKYTIGLPETILSAIRGEAQASEESSEYSSLVVSLDEKKLFEVLDTQISLSVNDKEGFVDLSVTTDDAIIAAVLTQEIKALLQEQIISYKINMLKSI